MHLSRGEKKSVALKNAISEITIPIIGSTITPVVVFLPLALLNGVTGVFFRSLALTMTVALLTSLVLAYSFGFDFIRFFAKLGNDFRFRANDSGYGFDHIPGNVSRRFVI